MNENKKPLAFYLLCFLHFFLGISGTAGGFLLVIRPDGSKLGMQSDWLAHSPFDDYLLPGLLLLAFIGLLPLFTLTGLLLKSGWSFPETLNLYPERHWAWAFSLYTGICCIIWIAVQQMLTQYFWLQPVILFVGLSIIILTLIPAIMKYFER